MIGAHYTHSRVPLGLWVQDVFGLARNHYDRLAHFLQGFAPALLMREIFIRQVGIRRGNWLEFLVVFVCLALSAAYELMEWWAWQAILLPRGGTNVLGMQGDIWDTHWDMFLAMMGATAALMLFSRCQDLQLSAMGETHAD